MSAASTGVAIHAAKLVRDFNGVTAVDGVSSSVGVVSAPPPTTLNGVDTTASVSLVVATDTVLGPGSPLVSPRSVSCSSSPGFTNCR